MGPVLAAAVVVSCSSQKVADAPGACSVAEDSRAIDRSTEPSPPEDLLQWTGFREIGELEVLDADEECGRDAAARVALRGRAAEIDAALEAAGFVDAPSPGLSVLEVPLDGIDFDDLTEVVSSGRQVWENDAGEQITRVYVRGRTGDGDQELLHLWAFTT
jgi:hypothetical protein